MWTKCIKSNVAAVALLAGVEDPTGIIKNISKDNSSKLNIYYSNNTIHAMPPLNKVDGTLEVYTLKGRLMYRKDITDNYNNSVRINTGNFASGVYHVRLISRVKTISAKIAITR